MNIFELPIEEFEKELQKIFDSYSDEEFIKALKKARFEIEEKEKENMKSKKFYILMDKNTLSYHEESGCTTNDIEEAAHFKTASGAFHYIKTEIGDDYQKDFLVYKVDMHLNFELIEEDEI